MSNEDVCVDVPSALVKIDEYKNDHIDDEYSAEGSGNRKQFKPYFILALDAEEMKKFLPVAKGTLFVCPRRSDAEAYLHAFHMNGIRAMLLGESVRYK